MRAPPALYPPVAGARTRETVLGGGRVGGGGGGVGWVGDAGGTGVGGEVQVDLGLAAADHAVLRGAGLLPPHPALAGHATPHTADAEGAARLVLNLHQAGSRRSPSGLVRDAGRRAPGLLGTEPAVVRGVLVRTDPLNDLHIPPLVVTVPNRSTTPHTTP